MKNIIFLLLFSCLATISFGQVTGGNFVSQYSKSLDTITNAGVKLLTLPSSIPSTGYFKTAFVVFKADGISGTQGGTAQLEVNAGSATDTVYVAVGSAFTIANTLWQTSALGTPITGWYGRKMRIRVTGAGTQSTKISASVLFKN